MAARIDERAIVVLAVDLDQGLAHLAQELHADGDVVDEGARAAIGELETPQDQQPVGLQAIIGDKAQHWMIGSELEARSDLALARAAPHQRSIAAAADG